MVKYQSRSVMVQKVAGLTAKQVGLFSFITSVFIVVYIFYII